MRIETGFKPCSEVCTIVQSPFLQDRRKNFKGRNTFVPEALPWSVRPPPFREQWFGMGQTTTPLEQESWGSQGAVRFPTISPVVSSHACFNVPSLTFSRGKTKLHLWAHEALFHQNPVETAQIKGFPFWHVRLLLLPLSRARAESLLHIPGCG